MVAEKTAIRSDAYVRFAVPSKLLLQRSDNRWLINSASGTVDRLGRFVEHLPQIEHSALSGRYLSRLPVIAGRTRGPPSLGFARDGFRCRVTRRQRLAIVRRVEGACAGHRRST
jgi:hypothetical protein